MAFLAAGDARWPLVVWLHGFPRNAYVWRGCLRAAQARGLRSLAFDLPGLGESEGPQAADHRPGAAAEVLGEFLDAYEAGRFALVAEGTGAAVAVELARRRSGSVRALALCDPGAAGPLQRIGVALARLGGGDVVLSTLRLRRALDRLDPRDGAVSGAALERDLALRPLLATPESRARSIAFLRQQHPPALAADGVPVLVCESARHGARVAEAGPRVRLPAAALELARRDPDALLDALLPFLTGAA